LGTQWSANGSGRIRAQLATLTEEALKAIGWGYRAPRLVQTVTQLEECGGVDWLRGLRAVGREAAGRELMQLCGVGRKVADCICLFGAARAPRRTASTHDRLE
jgi:N-glycosylase/DNA lyase